MYLSQLKPEIFAAILAAFLTLLIPIILHFMTKLYEKRNELNRELRDKKVPLYEGFIEFYFKIVNAEKIGDQKLTEIETTKFLNKFIQQIIVWWPDKLLKIFCIFRRKIINSNGDNNSTKDAILLLEELFFEMRKDLGYKNKNILKGDISSLYINDFEEYFDIKLKH
jgi:hypothetical protein